MTNVKLLKERIARSGMKNTFIADSIGMSRASWYNKREGRTEFTADEIKKLCDILHITSLRERDEIFFS